MPYLTNMIISTDQIQKYSYLAFETDDLDGNLEDHVDPLDVFWVAHEGRILGRILVDEVPYPMEAQALGNVAVLRLEVDGSNAGSWILEDVPKAHLLLQRRLLDEDDGAAVVQFEGSGA